MRFDILTIFPNIFNSYLNESIIKRALDKKKIKVYIHNIRDFADDKHKTVDDIPYGGGVGMVMKAGPIYRAYKSIRRTKKSICILLSAKGETWNQQTAQKMTEKYTQIILICGRYEGVDERVRNFIDAEISIGNYVLTGGELPAMVILDSVTRLLPGVLGKDESSTVESHSKKGYIEYPHYTRPRIFKIGKKSYSVPEVLTSGNHAEIKKWRDKMSKK